MKSNIKNFETFTVDGSSYKVNERNESYLNTIDDIVDELVSALQWTSASKLDLMKAIKFNDTPEGIKQSIIDKHKSRGEAVDNPEFQKDVDEFANRAFNKLTQPPVSLGRGHVYDTVNARVTIRDFFVDDFHRNPTVKVRYSYSTHSSNNAGDESNTLANFKKLFTNPN